MVPPMRDPMQVQEGTAIYKFAANDAESAARVMRGLLQDEDWLNGVAVRARSLAAGQFNRDLLASRLEEVLTRAARGDKAA